MEVSEQEKRELLQRVWDSRKSRKSATYPTISNKPKFRNRSEADRYSQETIERNIRKVTYNSGAISYKVEKTTRNIEGNSIKHKKNFKTITEARDYLEKLCLTSVSRKSGNKVNNIYFIHNKTTNQIKIGTAVSPKQRFNAIKCEMFKTLLLHGWKETQLPKLRLLGYIEESSQYTETSLHARFNSARLHGEWFTPTEDLKALINSLVKFRGKL